ncbi:MAG: hypothetical protein UZ01_01680 [Candidatus Brocadia sinica]|nr:MAG: hypothetical protein UZ01_01680 [Candidatus Brocadia sinica]
MRFLVDECTVPAVTEWLRREKHQDCGLLTNNAQSRRVSSARIDISPSIRSDKL